MSDENANDKTITPPTWQMDENGNAVANLPIKGVTTRIVLSEPTMGTIDKLACYNQNNPGQLIFAMCLCVADTMVEPKNLSFDDLCKLPFREGKEVIEGLKCFPIYAQSNG
jgi:hypothetical protein